MNESKLHAIYAWLDPRKPGNFIYEGLEFVFEYEPFYVGQTVDLKDRKRCHLKNSYSCRDSNIFKSRKFNKIKSETGNHPIFLVIRENLSREDANNTEVDMISKIGTMNSGLGPLTNLTIGADKGVLGLRWSKESKEKRKGAGNPMYGKTGELHHFFGVKFSEETRKKQSIKKLKYIYHIFDPDGKEFITTNLRVWEKENEFRYGSISKIVRGEVGHYKGWTAYKIGRASCRERVSSPV